ncbi:MAG TPA: hypothetical protein VFP37_11605 [Steroidobacteraceae bacterium]|nr:hypothetical protein [Steroidobacteraceae bacterium]
MQAGAPNFLPYLIVVPLVLWRLYRRVKRNIGRQHLTKWRPWLTMTLFPAIVILISLGALAQPLRLAALAAGIVAGAVLGVFGTRHTKFEVTPQGLFYTPNAHIGIALSLLFVGRVIYRMMVLYSQNPYAAQSPQDFSSSPLTLGIFGLLAGYYVTYAVGLVRWRQGVSGRESESTSTGS